MVPRHIFFVVCGLPLSKLSCDLFSKIQDFWQSASFGEIEVKQCTALAPYWVTHELALVGNAMEAREQLARYLLLPEAHIKTVAGWRRMAYSKHPSYLALRERIYHGLQEAGMPMS